MDDSVPLRVDVNHYYKSLKLIFYGLLSAQVIFALLVLFKVWDDPLKSDQDDFVLVMQYFVPTLVVAMIISSRLFFRAWVRKAFHLQLSQQLKIHQSGSIVRWALIEGGTLVSLLVFLLSSDYFFLSCAAFSLYFFWTHKPKIAQIAEDLDWDPEQTALFKVSLQGD